MFKHLFKKHPKSIEAYHNSTVDTPLVATKPKKDKTAEKELFTQGIISRLNQVHDILATLVGSNDYKELEPTDEPVSGPFTVLHGFTFTSDDNHNIKLFLTGDYHTVLKVDDNLVELLASFSIGKAVQLTLDYGVQYSPSYPILAFANQIAEVMGNTSTYVSQVRPVDRDKTIEENAILVGVPSSYSSYNVPYKVDLIKDKETVLTLYNSEKTTIIAELENGKRVNIAPSTQGVETFIDTFLF